MGLATAIKPNNTCLRIYPELYYHNLFKNLAKLQPYQPKEKEKPSPYKMELLNNPFPITLENGKGQTFTIFVNDRCDIIFKSDKHSEYYDNVANKYIATLKLAETK